MPHDAPASKVAATRGYGAEIVVYERGREDRAEVAGRIAAERGAPIVPPFDDPTIVAGQGTVALELFEQAGKLDVLVAPLGGGGLLSGSAVVGAGSARHRDLGRRARGRRRLRAVAAAGRPVRSRSRRRSPTDCRRSVRAT